MRGGDEDRLQRIIDKRLELLTLGDKHFLVQTVLNLNEETMRQAEEKHELQQRLEYKHERLNELIVCLRELVTIQIEQYVPKVHVHTSLIKDLEIEVRDCGTDSTLIILRGVSWHNHQAFDTSLYLSQEQAEMLTNHLFDYHAERSTLDRESPPVMVNRAEKVTA